MQSICLYVAPSHNLHLYTLIRFPRKAFFSKFQELSSSLSLSFNQMLQSLIHLCGLLQYYGSVSPYLYCNAKSATGHSTPEVVLPVPNREDRSLPGNVLPHTAQDSADLPATRVHCWFIFSLVTISTFWCSSAKLFTSGQSPAFTRAWGYSCPSSVLCSA